MNCQHRCDLIDAEEQRVLNHPQQALDLYDRAIEGAKAHDYTQEAAIANELAARFYLDWGKTKVAAGYMQEAYYIYSRWGAIAKVSDLEERYPELLKPILQPALASGDMFSTLMTITAPAMLAHTRTQHSSRSTNLNQAFDFASILKASQALSSLIDLDELLKQLTQIILQNSGGDRCALVVASAQGSSQQDSPTPDASDRDQWLVRAIATAEETTLCADPLHATLNLPVKLIQYVKNTQKTVVINSLETDLPVVGTYLKTQQPKSVLCLPIVNQSHLIGILYLSNRLTSDVFTQERILVLNFLCTQAAISLENARLYQKVEQTLSDLQQAQLKMVQNEKMSALGNLVSGVAHEINNPVGCILGNVGATKAYIRDLLGLLDLYAQQFPHPGPDIEDELEDIDLDYIREDLPQLIRAMKDSGDRIKSISKSLRTFSRADQDTKQSFDIHEGIESTVLILRHRLKANEQRPAISVMTDYGNLPAIECFPGQLNQVFMNILANAIDALDEASQGRSADAMQAEPQRITIKTSVDNGYAKIAIADNGPGIPESAKASIFDRLFTTKAVGKGTGLGLAIARQIVVDTHEGYLDMQSEIGQGTQFCIRLPL